MISCQSYLLTSSASNLPTSEWDHLTCVLCTWKHFTIHWYHLVATDQRWLYCYHSTIIFPV